MLKVGAELIVRRVSQLSSAIGLILEVLGAEQYIIEVEASIFTVGCLVF